VYIMHQAAIAICPILRCVCITGNALCHQCSADLGLVTPVSPHWEIQF
jgi:hypothetical protein